MTNAQRTPHYTIGCAANLLLVQVDGRIVAARSKSEPRARENMQALIDRANGYDALITQNRALADALREVLEYFEDREDVVDGDYGQPKPNEAMRQAQMIRAALAKVSP
jgi:hypothetical protein